MSAWAEAFNQTLPLFSTMNCSLVYHKGWDKKNTGTPLDTLLLAQYELDVYRQYTHSGAHQADISFDLGPLNAKQHLSRGQQKLILIAMKLAQAKLLEKACIYLFDDITSELDGPHIQRLLTVLDDIPGQHFFTSTDPSLFSHYLNNASFFSLAHGVAISATGVSRETSVAG